MDEVGVPPISPLNPLNPATAITFAINLTIAKPISNLLLRQFTISNNIIKILYLSKT